MSNHTLNRIDELTGLRCLAVSMVVLGHAEKTVDGGYSGFLSPLKIISSGSLGVLIFFVLSGYLITTILHKELQNFGEINLLKFYARRALRIWPASYVYILTIILFTYLGYLDTHWLQATLAALHVWNYSALLGLDITNHIHLDGAWYFGHFWSLALEEQFYWFWPFLLPILLRLKTKSILLAIILTIPIVRIVSYFAFPEFRGQLGMMLHSGIDPILIGCYVALNRQNMVDLIGKHQNIYSVFTFLIFILFILVPVLDNKLGGLWSMTYGKSITAAIAGMLIIIISEYKDFWFSRLLRFKFFVFIGTISYSLYLWQQLFTGINSPVGLSFPLNILGAFLIATLSYFLIERPFLQLKNRFNV